MDAITRVERETGWGGGKKGEVGGCGEGGGAPLWLEVGRRKKIKRGKKHRSCEKKGEETQIVIWLVLLQD